MVTATPQGPANERDRPITTNTPPPRPDWWPSNWPHPGQLGAAIKADPEGWGVNEVADLVDEDGDPVPPEEDRCSAPDS